MPSSVTGPSRDRPAQLLHPPGLQTRLNHTWQQSKHKGEAVRQTAVSAEDDSTARSALVSQRPP